MPPRTSILETIGNTPVVRLNKLAPEGVEIFVKVEAFNPLGSVKDRLALAAIEAAEASGALKPGQTVIEATSGNTGIGLAMVCAAKGYPLVIVMAESFSVERRRLMRFLGAQVVLTPAAEKGTGMVEKARELAATHGWFWVRQFENAANADVHSRTTAREILADFPEGLDYFVTGAGTGGTLKGVARVLKAESPATRIVAAEPDNNPLLTSGIAQAYHDDGTPNGSHPNFRPHPVQGWAPDFIPWLTGTAMADGLVDIVQPIDSGEAMRLSRELARQEGIFCGISSGGSLAAAMEIAKYAPAGTKILAMLPDTGERYLSTPLFAEIGQEMDEAERAISDSTPHCRFGAPAPAAPAATEEPEEIPARATAFVDEAIGDKDRPLVMFALEWCEFCWAVRNCMADMGVDMKVISLDTPEMHATGMGGDIRKDLKARTGAPTIPQVFLAGAGIGGGMDILGMQEKGVLADRLEALGMKVAGDRGVSGLDYLPKWIARRSA